MSSYHIQDLCLVLPTRDFDLRINKHCAGINPLFRAWLQELFHGDTARAEELSEHRFDLLCSLCFPTIDPPQLLRVSKLCALTFLANDGHDPTESSPSQWLVRYVPYLVEPSSKALKQSAAHSGPTPGSSLISPEHFLEVAHSIGMRRAQELEQSPPAASGVNILLRFTGSLLSSFYSPRETDAQSSRPGLPELLSVLENVYDRKLSEGLINIPHLAALWKCITNIVMWSQDLASYTSRHPQNCGRCTICYSLEERGFGLQAAVNDVRQNIHSEVGKFVHNYKSLTVHAGDGEDVIVVANAMRDCVTGFIHWIYEGERYFGKRYEEVAKFGWVFTDTGAHEISLVPNL